MKRKLITLLTIVSMMTVTLFTGCGSSTNTASQKQQSAKKKYIIATDAKYAPFEFKQNDKYIGIDIDLLAAIAKEEGFEYELKPMDFDGIIPGLVSGQLDGAIAGITITDKRKQAVDFSKGYYESGLTLIANSNNNTIKSANDLKGKKFAIKKGTEGATFAENNKAKYNGVLNYFNDTPSMFQDVINGNSDVTFEDYPVIAYELSVKPDTKLKMVAKLDKAYYGFAVKKGTNKELIDMFNKGYDKLKSNGEYDKIIAKYIKK